jgi:molybdenum cofactor guanylyltransferase
LNQQRNNITGLILCGGRSQRMNGMHKSLLKYHHGIEQYIHLYNLLKPLVGEVLISIREEDAHLYDPAFNYIFDAYHDIGPISGLATAFEHDSNRDYFIIGCDYPYITAADVQALFLIDLSVIDVACYKNAHSIEPLIALYSHNCASYLKNHMLNGEYSLKIFIEKSNHQAIRPNNDQNIKSIDNISDYKKILENRL